MNFKTLDLSIDNDLQEWKFFISRNSRHFDIFYTHEYLNLFVNKHQKIFISLCQYKDFFWINCFLKTEILNYQDTIKEKIYDIETPYGYGGPISNTTDKKFIKHAESLHSNWCKINRIVCEFVRFHPLKNNQDKCSYLDNIILERENRFLKIEEFNNISLFNPKVRNKIRKASRNNLNCYFSKSKEEIIKFKQLYLKTLDRLEADEFYYFKKNFYEKLYKLIKKNGFIISVEDKNKNLVGSSIFLTFNETMHYYLSALDKKKKIPGIHNYILYEAYLECKKKNISICNLGGGTTNNLDDNLLIFKKSMSNAKSNFYYGYKIFLKKNYQKLVNAFKENHPQNYKVHKKKILCYKYD
ncbi:hypothetical protein OA187_04910 [Candidatus Pelagibacter sp.]|nr:hypothetical protein [Candidatus Pelagibacter sp.]